MLIEDVKKVVLSVLEIEDRADSIGPDTELLGNVPELDSMAVVELVAALETHFGITIDDDEVDAELFESLTTLTAFVASKSS